MEQERAVLQKVGDKSKKTQIEITHSEPIIEATVSQTEKLNHRRWGWRAVRNTGLAMVFATGLGAVDLLQGTSPVEAHNGNCSIEVRVVESRGINSPYDVVVLSDDRSRELGRSRVNPPNESAIPINANCNQAGGTALSYIVATNANGVARAERQATADHNAERLSFVGTGSVVTDGARRPIIDTGGGAVVERGASIDWDRLLWTGLVILGVLGVGTLGLEAWKRSQQGHEHVDHEHAGHGHAGAAAAHHPIGGGAPHAHLENAITREQLDESNRAIREQIRQDIVTQIGEAKQGTEQRLDQIIQSLRNQSLKMEALETELGYMPRGGERIREEVHHHPEGWTEPPGPVERERYYRYEERPAGAPPPPREGRAAPRPAPGTRPRVIGEEVTRRTFRAAPGYEGEVLRRRTEPEERPEEGRR